MVCVCVCVREDNAGTEWIKELARLEKDVATVKH